MDKKDLLVKKAKNINDILPKDLLGTLLSQLFWCSENARKTGKITQENLGRILTVNDILINHYKMTWKETRDLFTEYGLQTDMIEK